MAERRESGTIGDTSETWEYRERDRGGHQWGGEGSKKKGEGDVPGFAESASRISKGEKLGLGAGQRDA